MHVRPGKLKVWANLTPALWPAVIGLAIIAAYVPTLLKLIDGPWQTEQEGHGPIIVAGSLWLMWSSRRKLANIVPAPMPMAGWACLGCGLVLLFLARTQDFLPVEAASGIAVVAGCVLLFGGWEAFRVLAFPIAFLIFAVPVPDTIIVAITVPLKVLISDVVVEALYRLDYPIAQNGVMIMISTYQLLVKDACSGLNSIVALSAIGLFYVYAFRWATKLRALALLSLVVPITVFANFIRVLTLVLIAYYGGVDLLEGPLHDLTGVALFIVAIVLFVAVDAACGALFGLFSSVGGSGPSRAGGISALAPIDHRVRSAGA